MAIWDNWSTVKKTRAIIGVTILGALLLYGTFMDLMGW